MASDATYALDKHNITVIIFSQPPGGAPSSGRSAAEGAFPNVNGGRLESKIGWQCLPVCSAD